MGLKKDQVNITISMTKQESEKLADLVNYFGEESVNRVNRADVMRYLINRYHFLISTGKMEEVFKAVESALGDEIVEQAK